MADPEGALNRATLALKGTGGASCFRPLVYGDPWPGVDLVFATQPRGLKYEFPVRPGGDPNAIVLAYEGIESLDLLDSGDLRIRTGAGEARDSKPYVYQTLDGEEVPVHGAFRILERDKGGFSISSADPAREIVIDTSLSFSTYLGGGMGDLGAGVAIGPSGLVLPMIAEVNGDGVSDIGIFRNIIARWWFLCSPSWGTVCLSQSFGQSGDIPIFATP